MEKKILFIAIIFIIIATAFSAGCIDRNQEEKRYVVDYKIVDDDVGETTLVKKEYKFTYNGKQWHIVASVPQYRYNAYVNEKYLIVKKKNPTRYDTYHYKVEPEQQRAFIIDEYVNDVVEQFKIQNGRLTDEELINVMTYFVQSQILYVDDNVQYGKEYIAYPMQTLINGKGDCDCAAVLLASLLNHAGYYSVTVYINYGADGHLFVGVDSSQINLPYKGITIIGNEKVYYVIDSTSISKVGELDIGYIASANEFYRVYDKIYEYGYQEGELFFKRDAITGSILMNNYKED